MTVPTDARGPIDVLRTWFLAARESNSTIVALTMCVLGLFMLSRGLERWRVVAFQHDTGASRSPVPYRTTFNQWKTARDAAGLNGTWYIAVSSSVQIGSACEVARAAPRSFARRLAILAADEARGIGKTTCAAQSPGGDASIPVVSRTYKELGLGAEQFLQSGVALLDERLQVRYASRWPDDLARLSSILENYSSETRVGSR